MSRLSTLFRCGSRAALLLAGVAFGGCNMLLDNEPAVLETPDRRQAGRGSGGSSASGAAGDAPSERPSSEPAAPKGAGRDDAGATPETVPPPTSDAGSPAPACDVGRADCDGLPGNGCEADLATDVAHCGACGVACPAAPGTVATCTTGVCTTSCAAGFLDCNEDPADGCETDVRADRFNCGACRRICIWGECADGSCRWTP